MTVLPQKALVDGFVHRPGKHCGSTALSDFFSAQGMALSEIQAIGLGGAPGAAFFAFPGLSPSHYVLPRNPGLEQDAFNALGIPFNWKIYKDTAAAERELLESIAKGRPVLLQTDIRYLAHYNTKTHFNGHVVVAAGYDLDQGLVFLADTQFEGLQPVGLEDLSKARFSKAPPLPLMGNSFVLPEEITLPATPQTRHHLQGLGRWVAHRQGLTPTKSLMSLEAMEALVREMPNFAKAPDANWVAKWTYQIVERRGTGGGGFRQLFAQYLSGLKEEIPQVDEAAQLMSQSAAHWSEMAETMKVASDDPSVDQFEEAAIVLGKALLAEKETVRSLEPVVIHPG